MNKQVGFEQIGPTFKDTEFVTMQESARRMVEQMGPIFQTIQDSNIVAIQESAQRAMEQIGPTFKDNNFLAMQESVRRMVEQMGPTFQTIQDSNIAAIQESARRTIEQIGPSVQIFKDTNFLAMQENIQRMVEQMDSTITSLKKNNISRTETIGEVFKQMEESDLFMSGNVEIDSTIIFGEVLDDSNDEKHSLAIKLKETLHSIETFCGFAEGQIINEFRSWALNKVFDGVYSIFISIIILYIPMFIIFNDINNDEFANYPQQEKIYLKQRVHEIKQKVEETGNSNIRLVTKDILIYSSDKRSSTKVGELYIGDEVTVLKKNKNWSKIKWVEEGNTSTTIGWVYTRYLKKIN